MLRFIFQAMSRWLFMDLLVIHAMLHILGPFVELRTMSICHCWTLNPVLPPKKFSESTDHGIAVLNEICFLIGWSMVRLHAVWLKASNKRWCCPWNKWAKLIQRRKKNNLIERASPSLCLQELQSFPLPGSISIMPRFPLPVPLSLHAYLTQLPSLVASGACQTLLCPSRVGPVQAGPPLCRG